jgi:hypothetical protein
MFSSFSINSKVSLLKLDEQPQLPDLIRPEIDLLNALAVTRKMKLGWSFGDNQTQGDNVEARGTVSWTPRLRAIDA